MFCHSVATGSPLQQLRTFVAAPLSTHVVLTNISEEATRCQQPRITFQLVTMYNLQPHINNTFGSGQLTLGKSLTVAAASSSARLSVAQYMLKCIVGAPKPWSELAATHRLKMYNQEQTNLGTDSQDIDIESSTAVGAR